MLTVYENEISGGQEGAFWRSAITAVAVVPFENVTTDKLCAERVPRSCQSRFHRSFAAPKHDGHVLNGQAVQVVQRQNRLIPRRDRQQRPLRVLDVDRAGGGRIAVDW